MMNTTEEGMLVQYEPGIDSRVFHPDFLTCGHETQTTVTSCFFSLCLILKCKVFFYDPLVHLRMFLKPSFPREITSGWSHRALRCSVPVCSPAGQLCLSWKATALPCWSPDLLQPPHASSLDRQILNQSVKVSPPLTQYLTAAGEQLTATGHQWAGACPRWSECHGVKERTAFIWIAFSTRILGFASVF